MRFSREDHTGTLSIQMAAWNGASPQLHQFWNPVLLLCLCEFCLLHLNNRSSPPCLLCWRARQWGGSLWGLLGTAGARAVGFSTSPLSTPSSSPLPPSSGLGGTRRLQSGIPAFDFSPQRQSPSQASRPPTSRRLPQPPPLLCFPSVGQAIVP